MNRSDFAYDLPRELIAQEPLAERASSPLPALDGVPGAILARRFADVVEQLRAGALLVLTDTRVLPARLAGRKRTGGRVAIMLERVLDARRVLAQVRASHAPQPGSDIELPA